MSKHIFPDTAMRWCLILTLSWSISRSQNGIQDSATTQQDWIKVKVQGWMRITVSVVNFYIYSYISMSSKYPQSTKVAFIPERVETLFEPATLLPDNNTSHMWKINSSKSYYQQSIFMKKIQLAVSRLYRWENKPQPQLQQADQGNRQWITFHSEFSLHWSTDPLSLWPRTLGVRGKKYWYMVQPQHEKKKKK